MLHLGDVPAGTTIYIPFHTFNSSGASVTITGLAVTDIEIYKNGSVTQRASDNGYTLLDTDGIDFDGLTGIHGFSVDLSNNSDSGFYSAGAFYWVVVSSITVDSQTVSFVAATFRIVNAESTAGTPVVGLTTSYDTYHADINFTDDDLSSTDEYTVTWFKNGVRQTSGITSPTIQVVKRADGTDLVASTAMTQVGSTGSYRYNETTNRVTTGEAVLVVAGATIDGSARTFAKLISRDT